MSETLKIKLSIANRVLEQKTLDKEHVSEHVQEKLNALDNLLSKHLSS